jgi:tetratricopeptide (TPR) repeat protein/serine/threonine protein kinase
MSIADRPSGVAPSPGAGSADRSPSADDARVLEAVREYLALIEAGRAPDRAAFVARYPDVAAVLSECLEGLAFVRAAAPELSQPVAGGAAAAPATGDESLTGTLGDFRLIREVGRGGMGVVYEAEQISLGRRVALKVLPFAATMDPRGLQRFHNEARAAAGLHHTNIVPVYGVGCERGVQYYAMQFIEGRTLADFIAQQQGVSPSQVLTVAEGEGVASATTVPPAAQATSAAPRDTAYFRRAAEWGIQAAEALDCAHTLGVVHRDVKPANLLVDGADRLWVTDFGLAQVQSDARLTMTGDLVGTLRYMSPEQALAKRVVIDHRTDVYSLGATLYELLTLRPVFGGTDRQELLRQIAFEEPKPPRRVNKAIPAELEIIVLKTLEKNPADRYGTAQALADDLHRWLEDRPIRARRPSVGQRARKWAQRHKPLVGAAAVCLLVTLVAGGGSVGWVLSDRASRQDKVREALEAAGPGLREGNPHDPVLITVVQRAEAQLGGGMVGEELRRRVEQLQKDVQMLAELERIRLDQAGVRDGHFDRTGADLQYVKAFREYGIDVETLGPQEVAAAVQGSAIRAHLVAGLYDWATGLADGQKGRQRLEVVRQADPHQWHDRLRAMALSRDSKELEQLAQSAPVEDLPSALLAQLGAVVTRRAESSQAIEPLLELMRRAQRRFPADFWINNQLACALHLHIQPPKLDEAIGFYRAALALRPLSPGAHLNLGCALYQSGNVEGAIAEYREAIHLKSDYVSAHCDLGLALRTKGQLDEAVAACREAIRHKKDSALAHNILGITLQDKGQLDDAIAEFREYSRLEPDSPLPHSNLGNALRERGQLDEAIAECHEAIRLNKDFAEAHTNLGIALHDKGQVDDAIAEYREAIRLKKGYAPAYIGLGNALRDKGQLDEAVAAFREAIRLKGNDAVAHNGLGNALRDKGQADDAIAEYREALRSRKDFAKAHNGLGAALSDKGQVDGAIAEWREAIRLKKDYAEAHNNLGVALKNKGQVDDAIAEYREAIRLKSDYSSPHVNLGETLSDRRDVDGAIAEYREAIRLKPDDPGAHYELAVELQNGKGDVDGAITEYREAIRLKKNYAEAHCNLGLILADKGEFTEGLTYLRRGHELGSKNPRWPYASAEWVRKCERRVELDSKLPRALKGEVQPVNVGGRLELAQLCQLPCKSLYAAAVRFYVAAFAEQPKLADDLQGQHRYNAACAAALAGYGQGKDADQTDAKGRARLRRQALEWLRADLAAYRQAMEKELDKAGPAIRERLQHWQQDTDFASVRGPNTLAKLPEAERLAWQQLWADVATTLARAQKLPAAEKKSGTK